MSRPCCGVGPDTAMNAELLEGIPLLATLSPEQRAELAGELNMRTVAAGDPIFWVGEPGDEMYVIRTGQVSIIVPDHGGKEIVLADLGAGAVFGEIALLDSGTRTATARARTDCVVLVLERSKFDAFVQRYPPVALQIMKILGARQRATVEKLRGIRDLNEIIEERLTPWERLSKSIARIASSQVFLLCHLAGFVAWISSNLAAGPAHALDPFPFPFLCFWSSTEAIFLSLFILVAQDQQGRKDRARTELEYQVALKMQVEMMQLHQKLDALLVARDEKAERRRKKAQKRLRPALQLTIRSDVTGAASSVVDTPAAQIDAADEDIADRAPEHAQRRGG